MAATNKLKLTLNNRNWFYILFLVGIALRLVQYFYNRSLWVDEAMLAVNFTERSFAGLAQPLQYGQIAPILFLWTEKLFVIIFGNNELSLRLFPLICSIASLWLTYHLAFVITKDKVSSLLILLFIAFSKTFIYFSNETKQYSSDVFLSLTFFYFSLSDNERIANNRITLLLIAGIISVWLSNVTIILITSLAAWYFINQINEKQFRVKEWLAVGLLYLWFGIYFFVLVKDNPNNAGMDSFWLEHFMPKNPFTIKFWSWLSQHFLANYATMIGFNNHQPLVIRLLAAFALIIMALYGYARLIRSNFKAALLLLLPVIIHLAVSSLHLYPFNGRLILYLIPSFLIPACFGISCFFLKFKDKFIARYAAYSLASVFAIFMILQIPFRLEEAKDCLEYVKKNNDSNALLIAYASSIAAVSYYSDNQYSFDKGKYTAPVKYLKSKEEVMNELNQNDAVWVLITHRTADQTELFSLPVKSLKTYSTNGAAVHLLVKN